MTEKTCECGCGESLEDKKANARYLNRAHKARARRRRAGTGSPERKAAQLDGLYRSGKDGLQKAIRADLAYREILPPVFKNPVGNDHKGSRRGSWRAYQDKDQEAARDRTDLDAARHPRGRLGQKRLASRKRQPPGSQPPPRGGRYGPTGDHYVDSTTGKPFDHRDTMLYRGLGWDGFFEMNRRINRRFEIARRALKEGRIEELASRLGFSEGLDYSNELWKMCAFPVMREFAAARVAARAALKGTEQLIEGVDMPPVATDSQLAQTVRTLEACRDVLSDCIEIVRSRFPDDEQIQSVVERLIESTQN